MEKDVTNLEESKERCLKVEKGRKNSRKKTRNKAGQKRESVEGESGMQ